MIPFPYHPAGDDLPTDPIELTRALLAIPSPSRHEGPAVDFLAQYLDARGWNVVRQPVSAGRDNIYARRGQPELVFSTHLDTVPPDVAFREDETFIFGRGACDAKGIAAAMVAAADELDDPRIALLFVVGEEDGSDGARAAATLAPKGRFLINGEPTDNLLVTAQKGTLKVVLDSSGRAAHSGYPELGDSAIERLLDALQRIRAVKLPVDPVLGPSTLNIGLIEGGAAPNVIAPSARAVLYLRVVGATADTEREILAAAGDGTRVTFIMGIPPATAPTLPGWASTTVAFASDLAYHGAWGTCYQLGPGSIHVAHTDQERISKAELHQGVAMYVRLARELLSA